MSRGVDDVDFGAFIVDGYVFRKNRDASLALQVVVVENEFAGVLVFTEKVAGKEHLVNQGGLSVVDVGDDGDVTDILHTLLDIFDCKGTKKLPNNM